LSPIDSRTGKGDGSDGDSGDDKGGVNSDISSCHVKSRDDSHSISSIDGESQNQRTKTLVIIIIIIIKFQAELL